MKIAIPITIILFILSFVIFIFFSIEEEVEVMSVEYVERGEEIRVKNNVGSIVFEKTISDFRNWAVDNWDDIFEIRPSFGELREVDPQNFYVFDNNASLSPKNNFLVFSVNDYAALTNLSFIVIVDLKEGEMRVINDYSNGQASDIIWSEDENYIAYTLDTARGQGEHLTVDNLLLNKKEFTLSKEDVENLTDFQEESSNFNIVGWDDDFVLFSINKEGGELFSVNKHGGEIKENK